MSETLGLKNVRIEKENKKWRIVIMSTYYNVYLFLRKKGEKNSEELEYIGAYDKEGLPAPIFAAYGSYIGEVVGERMSQKVKDLKIQGVEDNNKFFGYGTVPAEREMWSPECTVMSWNELNEGAKDPVKYGYIHKKLKRNIELHNYGIDEYLTNYYDEEDDDHPGIICTDEFEKLTTKEQKDYHFATWHDLADSSQARSELITAISCWWEVAETLYKLYNESMSDIILVSTM